MSDASAIDDARTCDAVEAAYAILEEAGLDGLTIRAVLTRTGLARRAFYERFGGKDDLVLAVFAHAMRSAARRCEEQLAGLADPFARLELVVTAIALGTFAGPAGQGEGRRGNGAAALSREHLRLAQSRPADLVRAVRPLLDLIARLLAEGMATGAIRPGEPGRMAMLVFNTVATTAHGELIGREDGAADRAGRAALAADVWDFCRRAVAA